MFHLFDNTKMIDYCPAGQNYGYPLGIQQESKKTKHPTWVRLFVDDNPERAIGEIITTDPAVPIQTYTLPEDDQRKIAHACREMIKCVTSGRFNVVERAKNDLDAVIQPYLDRLHQKILSGSFK